MSQVRQTTVHWQELFTRAHGPALALVCLGVWLHAADALVVATMMPAIVAELGGASLIHWSITLYEIGGIVVATASGLLVMRHGLQAPMALAATNFAIGCLISALALNMPTLLLGRLIQGLGGGGMMAMSFVAIGTLFPVRLTARVMAAVSTLWGVSAFVGPLVGGLMVEYASWRWGFAAFAVQAALLAGWIVSQQGALNAAQPLDFHVNADERFPLRRLGLLCLGVSLIAASATLPNAWATLGVASMGAVCLGWFLRLDAGQDSSRMLPRQPFNLSGPIGSALLLVLCFAIATVAITLYGPLFLAGIHGVSALTVGLILAVESVCWSVAAVLVSGQPEQDDARWIGRGLLIVTIGVVGFTFALPYGPLALITGFAALQGTGFGMAWTFLVRQATALAPTGETERVTGAIPSVQRLGFALGAAWTGIVANAVGFSTTADVPEQRSMALWVFGACLPLLLVGAVAAWRFTGLVRER